MLLKDFPKDERPRERFIKLGPQNLSNQELIAIILRTGTKAESVIQLAQRLIKEFEGLRMLKDATLEELTKIKGIGKAKAIQLLAAVELGRRINSLTNEERYAIRSPEDGANYVMDEMRFLNQEHFVCLYLKQKIKSFINKRFLLGV